MSDLCIMATQQGLGFRVLGLGMRDLCIYAAGAIPRDDCFKTQCGPSFVNQSHH